MAIVQSASERATRLKAAVDLLQTAAKMNSDALALERKLRAEYADPATVAARCQAILDEAEDIEQLAGTELSYINWTHQVVVDVGEPPSLAQMDITVNDGEATPRGDITAENSSGTAIAGFFTGVFSAGDEVQVIDSENDNDGVYGVNALTDSGATVQFDQVLPGTLNASDSGVRLKLMER